jgi:hypothetical protein
MRHELWDFMTAVGWWWLLVLGTSVGGLLWSIDQQPGMDALLSSRFWGPPLVALVPACFAAWREQKQRAERSESELQGLRTASRDVEWSRAIETLQGLWNYQIDAVLTRTTRLGVTTEAWGFHVFQAPIDHDAAERAIDTACRLAGHALSLSKTWVKLPAEITRCTDHLEIWLRFVVSQDGFGGMTGSGITNVDGIQATMESESVHDLVKKSKRLCEYVRNRESIL